MPCATPVTLGQPYNLRHTLLLRLRAELFTYQTPAVLAAGAPL